MAKIVRQLVFRPMKAMKAIKEFTAGWQKRHVFMHKVEETSGCLRRCDLVMNKHNRPVSKKRSFRNKKNPWIAACNTAKKALKLKGFVKPRKGSALYKKTKQLYKR